VVLAVLAEARRQVGVLAAAALMRSASAFASPSAALATGNRA